MKSFNRMAAAVFFMMAVIMAGTNGYLRHIGTNTQGRMYRVEAVRLAEKIRKQAGEEYSISQRIDLSDCQYVNHVERFPVNSSHTAENWQEFLEGTGSDYFIFQIGDALYRFDYSAQTVSGTSQIRTAVSIALAVAGLLLLLVMLYIRQNIIEPFEMLKEVPFELAKGRIAAALPQSRSRFFGRFVWGMDLLREYIEKQKKREQQLQREQKTLILSVSHDIKTPLSAITLYAKVISRHMYEDTAQLDAVAAKIQEKADEIGSFIAQIIKASSEDFLNLEVAEGAYYLSQLVKKTAAYYEDKLRMLHTEFVAGDYADCMLRGDFDRSVEVLQNMMENAVKYGDGRKVALSFSQEEDCVLVTVTNSGSTLPETEMVHIFDSFWRGSNAKGCSGSGLGLYICRMLMNRMGGDVFAQIQGDEMCVTAVFAMAS